MSQVIMEDSIRYLSRRIVERDGHVSWSVRRAAYHVISRLKGKRRAYRKLARPVRRALWQGAAAAVRREIIFS